MILVPVSVGRGIQPCIFHIFTSSCIHGSCVQFRHRLASVSRGLTQPVLQWSLKIVAPARLTPDQPHREKQRSGQLFLLALLVLVPSF